MARVKGSKERFYQVSHRDPRRWYLLSAALVAIVLATGVTSGWVGYLLGAESRSPPSPEVMNSERDLELKMALEAEARMKKQLETATFAAEVDRNALEGVRVEVADLRNQLAALQEENQFYRNLMSPAGSHRGLTFGVVEIVDTERPRAYRFKVVMQQLGTNQKQLNGTLSVNLVGRQAGERVVLPLKDVSNDIEATNIKLNFKYFQNIEGDLVLPDGFEPERIELEARSSQPSVAKIEKRYGWLVQER